MDEKMLTIKKQTMENKRRVKGRKDESIIEEEKNTSKDRDREYTFIPFNLKIGCEAGLKG